MDVKTTFLNGDLTEEIYMKRLKELDTPIVRFVIEVKPRH